MGFIKQLESELMVLVEEMQAINDQAQAENRSHLNSDENKKFADLAEKAKSLRMRLDEEYAKQKKTGAQQQQRADIPYVHQLTEFRANSGKLFREAIKAKGELVLELRETPSATTSTGVANAIPVYIKDFVEPLEKGLIYDKLGISIEYGLTGDVKYPIMPYIEATIAGEAVKLEDTTLAPDAINPKPKRIGVTCPITGLADIQTDMRVYNWILSALATAVARAVNRWAFTTVGINSNTFGIFAYNKTSNPIKTVQFAGALPTYKELLAMRGAVMGTGAYADGTYAYVMSSQMYAALEAEPKVAGGEQMIITNGKIGEIPVFVTEEIESTAKGVYNESAQHVGFGRFSDCKMAQFGNFKLIVNPYSGDTQDITRITVNTHWSVDCIRYGSFVIGTIKTAA